MDVHNPFALGSATSVPNSSPNSVVIPQPKPVAPILWAVLLLLAGFGAWLLLQARGVVSGATPEQFAAGGALLQNGQPAEALKVWGNMEQAPALGAIRPMALYYKAKAASQLPDENQAQGYLRQLLNEHSSSVWVPLALYELGASQFRARQLKEAQDSFSILRQRYPHTPYATGSLYYLGSIGYYDPKQPATAKAAALAYWLEYLNQSPQGRFAADIAVPLKEGLQAQKTPVTSMMAMALGSAFLAKNDATEAAHWLAQAPIDLAWFPLGQAYLKAGKTSIGLQILSKNLNRPEAPRATVKAAIEAALAALPNLNLQQQWLQAAPPVDVVLWQRKQYQALLAQYPRSEYAAESAWELMRPFIMQADWPTVLAMSKAYRQQYQQVSSASKVLFWQAKALEASHQVHAATEAYQQLGQLYPNTYEAFRAMHRLAVLTQNGVDQNGVDQNGVDRGWQLPALASPRFTQPLTAEQVLPCSILPTTPQVDAQSAQALLSLCGWAQHAYAAKTPNTFWGDAVTLWVHEALGDTPPETTAWVEAQQGRTDNSIRAARQAIQRLQFQGHPVSNALWRMSYPLAYGGLVAQAAEKTKMLSPFVIQGLMREESHFSPEAVSTSNALGLMQLLPSTAREVAQKLGKPLAADTDLFAPETNVLLGSTYLSQLFAQFSGHQGAAVGPMLAVGAYNGGPGAMSRWEDAQRAVLLQDPDLFVERIPYDQSRLYIAKVWGSAWVYYQLYR